MSRRWRWVAVSLALLSVVPVMILSKREPAKGWEWLEKLGGREVPVAGRVEAGGMGTASYTIEVRAYVIREDRKKAFWLDYHNELQRQYAAAAARGVTPERWLIAPGKDGTLLFAKLQEANWFQRQVLGLQRFLGIGKASVNPKEIWPPTAYLREVGEQP